MPSWRELWHIEFLGNDLGAWTLAIVTFLVTFTVLPIIKGYISTRRRRWTGHEPQQVHVAIDLTALLVERTSRVFLWGVALYLGSLHLSLPPRIEHALTVAGVMVFWMQAGLWAVAAVRHALDLRRKRSAGLDALAIRKCEGEGDHLRRLDAGVDLPEHHMLAAGSQCRVDQAGYRGLQIRMRREIAVLRFIKRALQVVDLRPNVDASAQGIIAAVQRSELR